MQGAVYRTLGSLLPKKLCWESGMAPLAILSKSIKTTTGIVGLPVDENARDNLCGKLENVLDSLSLHSIPPDTAYHKAVAKTVQFKLEALKTDKTDEELEDLFGAQLEDEIRKCDDELSLIPKMAEWKPWVVPEGYKIEVVEESEIESKVGGPAAK